MANIRVTCPACKSELEIDAAFEGQEVECGNCLEVFKAKAPGGAGSSRGGGKIPGAGTSGSGRGKPADRPAPKKRRRDDDDDDYEHDRRRDDDDDDYAPPPPRGRRGEAGDGGLGIASLILGIVSLLTAFATVCCCPLISVPFSLGAIVTGAIGLQKPESKVLSIIGLVLGVLSLGICVAMVAFTGFQMGANPNFLR